MNICGCLKMNPNEMELWSVSSVLPKCPCSRDQPGSAMLETLEVYAQILILALDACWRCCLRYGSVLWVGSPWGLSRRASGAPVVTC